MVTFEFEERNILSHLSIRIPVEEGKKVYREIMKHIEKYSHHETPKETAAEESTPSHGDGGSVREIRDMYESGIITKEEMMELLKETVKNK